MYTPSDTKLEWPGEGPLFESDSNKRWGPKNFLKDFLSQKAIWSCDRSRSTRHLWQYLKPS